MNERGIHQEEAAAAEFTPRPLDQAWLLSNIGYLATRVAAQIKRSFASHPTGPDLTAVEFSIIAVLGSNSQVNQKQLCLALDLSASSMAVILDRLVKRRLVRRERGTEDRRETYVHLTTSGSALQTQGAAVAALVDSEATSVLTDGERLLLVELLRKVARLRPHTAR